MYTPLLEAMACSKQSNVIPVFGPINADLAMRTISCLTALSNEDPTQEIQLSICSYGGEISAGLAILDTVLLLPNPISTIGLGSVASMAAILACCGGNMGHRYLSSNAELMLHQPVGQMAGSASEIENHTKHLLSTRQRINSLLSEATGLKPSRIARLLRQDRWFSAQEAVSFGLIDQILTPPCKPDLAETAIGMEVAQ